MSTMTGADVAELRALAADFDSRANGLRTLETQLNWRIHSAPWHGADVSRFQHDWNTRHRKAIATTAASITEAARMLRANADQQELASAATFTGRVPSVGQYVPPGPGDAGGGGGQDRGWIARALDLTDTVPWKVAGAATTLTGAVLTGIDSARLWSQGGRLAEFINATAKPLDALGHVGKWLGPVGFAFDGIGLVEDIMAGDEWGIAWSAASFTVGGLATMAAFGVGGALIVGAAPALAVAAAVVGVGSLVYHEREWIGDRLNEAGHAIAKASQWAASKAVDITVAAGDVVRGGAGAVKGAAEAVGGVAGSVVNAGKDFVEGIFRKPSWAPW